MPLSVIGGALGGPAGAAAGAAAGKDEAIPFKLGFGSSEMEAESLLQVYK